MAVEQVLDQIQVTTPEAVLSVDFTQKPGFAVFFTRSVGGLNPVLTSIEIPNDELQVLVDAIRAKGWIR